MKTTMETLTFPCEVIDKIKIKTSFRNLSIRFVNGHIIKFNKTNLSIREPHKIIISNSYNTLVALLYDDTNKIYIPNDNAVITLSKFIQIINTMNKQIK